MKDYRYAGFSAGEADGMIFPIHVLAFQTSQVALAPTEMPAQLIKLLAFWIFLTADNGLMLVESDRAFFLELDRRPLTFWNDGAGNPIHVEGKIMNAPQKNVC